MKNKNIMKNKRQIGNKYESLACEFLQKKNCTIIERNFRLRFGEIDIIARDEDYLVFVEVKYRKNNNLGSAIEAVTPKKVAQVIKMAQYYLYTKNFPEDINIRFDIITIDNDKISWIKNAFY